MTQILKTVAVIALGAFAASCAEEQTAALLGGETEVSFTVSAPVIQTRAEIADGTTVDKVACCVYDSNGTLIENGITQTIDMSDKKATFKTRLVTGQTYSFLFWAYKASVDEVWTSPYTLDATNKTVTVNYDNAASNDENRDAFYKYIDSMEIEGTVNETVELTRPFAQLNFGVEIEDIVAAKNAGITVSKSTVKLTGLANKFNFVTGEATAEGGEDDVTAEFTLADLPAGALPTAVSETYDSGILTVNEKKYGYVAMNYILVGKDKTLTDTKLTVAKGDDTEINTLEVTNVPLQANYRTNVLGNLFTSQVVNNIVVNAAFTEPDYEKEIWDGQINEPETDEDGTTYLITKPSELAWVAKQANSGTTFSDKTVQLQNDIDLCNGLWTPIGTSSAPFKGTFNGQNHTVTNLKVYSSVASDNLGLFGYIQGTSNTQKATIKNVTIDGANVISEVKENNGGCCGVAAGTAYNFASIEYVNVKNAVVTSNHYIGGICGNGYVNISHCSVDKAVLTALCVYWPGKYPNSTYAPNYENGDKVGGIIGLLGEGSMVISDNKVSNTSITGYRDLGGISAIARENPTFTNNSIGENVIITANAEHNYEDYTLKTNFNVGSIIGRDVQSNKTNNTGSATITYTGFEEIEISSVESANTLIKGSSEGDVIKVSLAANLSDVTTKAIVTTGLKSGAKLYIEVSSDDQTLYVGDFTNDGIGETLAIDSTVSAAADVYIIAPEGVTIQKLVIGLSSTNDNRNVHINCNVGELEYL